jgi:AAA ATPase domain/AAA domain
MKLTLENIGKIKHAEIDLSKDLIVLCGPNNTGKTYVAYSVFGLYAGNYHINGFSGPSEAELALPKGRITLGDFYEGHRSEVELALAKGLAKSLVGLFAANSDSFDQTSIAVSLQENEVRNAVIPIDQVPLHDNRKIVLYAQAGPEGAKWWIENWYEDHNAEGYFFQGREAQHASAGLDSILKEYLLGQVHIDPAERIAINVFSKELADRRTRLVDDMLDLNQESRRADLFKVRTSRYPLPIRQNIYLANQLDVVQKHVGPFADFASEIEETILFGKLFVGEYGEVLFVPHGSNTRIGIHMTGSVVKSLANIVFYLRHSAKSGDFYIIDEPELTLHPDNQRKMARMLARMMNAGIKIMMSTHSDYIIRELNNLMMLKTDHNPEKVAALMEKYGYKQEELLDHNRVGAYLFTEDVSPLEVNETGFEVKTIDDEIHSLNNSSADIFFSLHD